MQQCHEHFKADLFGLINHPRDQISPVYPSTNYSCAEGSPKQSTEGFTGLLSICSQAHKVPYTQKNSECLACVIFGHSVVTDSSPAA